MSSTTEGERPTQSGQILVIFAGGLVLICMIAALVFDVGQNLLDRRAEQNASDAAALAGARHIKGVGYGYHAGCSASHAGLLAVEAACEVAADNGFIDGQDERTVRVDIPPVYPSTKAGFPGHIEVTIGNTRPSFFMGVVGITQQRTGAFGVATNDSDIPLPYSLLALNDGCGLNKITGEVGSMVSTNGTVQIDSSCSTNPGALFLSGNGVLTAPECDVVGLIVEQGGADNRCTTAPTGVLVSGDPLRNLASPAIPALPTSVVPLDGGPIPSGCPGGGPGAATAATPAVCSFSKPTMNGMTYRIFPGLYPGGIEVTRATVYMDPGIYWIGGGGVTVKSTGPAGVFGRLISKASGDDTGTTPTGGVLIYNSKLPTSPYGPISLNGGDGSTLALRPIQTTIYKGMVIFVDRAAGLKSNDIDLNGGGSNLDVSGTIYAPTGEVKLNGSESDAASAQVICWNFIVNGSGAAFTIDYDPDDLLHVTGVGLVE